MGSPKRSVNQCLTPPAYHVDWDSPSTKTGTVKRRPNSCGDALKLMEFDVDVGLEFNVGDTTRKASLDANSMVKNEDENVLVKNAIEVDEDGYAITLKRDVVQDRDNKNMVDKIKSPIFCADVSVEDHKFLIDKMGKVKPESATLFSFNTTNEVVVKRNVSKLKMPSRLVKENDEEKSKEAENKECSSPKRTLSKLKLTFSPSKTNEKASKFRMFSAKQSFQAKQSDLKSLSKCDTNQRTISNEYVQFDFEKNNKNPGKTRKPASKVPSRIPITPVDGESKNIHLSPNKKYTVTSKYGIRCDKDNYVVFDPQGGFNSKVKKRTSLGLDSVSSDTDSGILSPASPFDVDIDRKNGYSNHFIQRVVSAEDDDDPDGEDLLRRVCEQEKVRPSY